ncbi:glycosyltransferase family 4 protein [Nonomuraea wenchangensis]|uniref:Glycosyltransferase involved in cell wall bisynthesis n=1 Tax=Nonomuraea wenchangensis TaxID=568860 RepID=A0A1I0ES79_9ACTN|nr:glycosyltransferase family 4 protein [Nonomuraea wenchangensis]SET48377.1 Glycosyltransferase involved in cell wall bisynthesis [Nonomuraea wenchangensis]
MPALQGKADRPKRIVVRIHSAPPHHNAGGEWALFSMLRPLAERGHDVQVWLSRYGKARDPYHVDGIMVIPLAARLDFGSAVRHADVVVSQYENVPAAGALARGYGIPFVVLAHNPAPVIFKNIAAGSTALVVYNSMHLQAEAEALFAERPKWLKPSKTLVVRPPVFAADYATTPGDLITMINLNREKGGDLFWKLAARLPEHRFLAVEGAYGHQIVRDLPNVEVIRQVPGDQMRDQVYARTRVLLVPSHVESWGRVGVEALASGIPVMATPTPGLSESLADAGIFCEAGDVEAWEASLRALDDPAEWSAASGRALQRSKELDPSGDLAAWVEAIENL